MPDYRLSRLAEADLAGIADYTIQTFGIDQARRYRDGLERCFQSLADDQLPTYSAEQHAAGLRRYTYQSHVIFFKPTDDGVFIVRVLHTRMDWERHL